MVRTVFRGESISYGYDKHQLILKDVSITIPDQSIFGIIGPSGAGKTTLAQVMLGLKKSALGKLTWFNELINASTNRRVGYVPYKKSLLYDLSVYENVWLFGKLYKYSGKRLKQQVEQALQFIGLWDARDRKVSSLPTYQQQQLNIACGIVHLPDVVIFDEPIKDVEQDKQALILHSIRQLNELGVTIVYLSQNVEEVEELCTHVGIMRDGKVIAQGKIDDLLKEHQQYRSLIRLQLAEAAEKLQYELGEYNICDIEAQAVIVEVNAKNEQEIQHIRSILGEKLISMDFINPKLRLMYSCLMKRKVYQHMPPNQPFINVTELEDRGCKYSSCTSDV